jgi:hypothetical protein
MLKMYILDFLKCMTAGILLVNLVRCQEEVNDPLSILLKTIQVPKIPLGIQLPNKPEFKATLSIPELKRRVLFDVCTVACLDK